jgi:Na+/H+-dicarboxylate symporter
MRISVLTQLTIGLLAGALLHAFVTEVSPRSRQDSSPGAGRFLRTYWIVIIVLVILTLQAYLLPPSP